ncbi:glycoside hydrolase family 5 protein [uncultured Mucilaginibacter sp.]|uniref:glycoside hydrolase family 5 protein n=1 Tax=uncultured Mucilaginibacter sp. TaxID=797541 RepID=UPI0025E9F386|nr:glycoside hydrolase family 5 protein [uncultured Mucilaginibacter sp.]
MKKQVLCLLGIAMSVFFASCKKKSAEGESKPKPEPQTYTAPAQPFGVNLAGAEFGNTYPGTINQHYGYPTAADLDYFKSKGLMLIRFPFRWERIQRSLYAELDVTELARMKTFVDAAKARNMFVLLDMHNYCRRKVGDVFEEIGSTAVPLESVGDAWAKLAAAFKGYDNIWGYGIMNEPYGLTKLTWFNIAQSIITKIRAVDNKTTIVVGGDSFSSASRWPEVSNNLKDLNDPSSNLFYEAHTYFDNDSSGNYDQSYTDEKANENTGVQRVTPFVQWLKNNNKRGFVGEYGVPRNDARWLVVLENMLKYLNANCVNGCYWAAGPRWPEDEHLSIQPWHGDLPQTAILQKYPKTNPENCK